MSYWHVREELLDEGALMAPGRWGQLVTAAGQAHPFFFREQLLELWRLTQTGVGISRLKCAFAYEDRDVARVHSEEDGQFLYEVVPADESEQGFRADMLWLTWMGEPGSRHDQISARCRAYWDGESSRDFTTTANPSWEWLFASGLRVVQRLTP